MLININELKRSAGAGFEYSNFRVKELERFPVYSSGGWNQTIPSEGAGTRLYPQGGLEPDYPPQMSEIFGIGCSNLSKSNS